jgi:diguanylate cyclase (GGDEF)-like protein
MARSLGTFSHSITGRLYAAIGVLCLLMLAMGLQTIVYSDSVAVSAHLVARGSIDALRAADQFDELMDSHRRLVLAADPASADELAGTETQLHKIVSESEKSAALTPPVAETLLSHIAALREYARSILSLPDEAARADARTHFVEAINAAENDVTEWKSLAREATSAELARMSARAADVHRLYSFVMVGACLIGLAAALVSRGVLRRLRRLTTAMLSLASGDTSTTVPFREEHDEVGRLADALEVFRTLAGSALMSEANLKAALESMIEGIAIFSEDHRVIWHNHKFLEMQRLDRTDCVGLSSAEIFRHLIDDQGWTAELVEGMQERAAAVRKHGGTTTFDIDLPDLRSYTVTVTLMPNGNLLVASEDVTDRRISAQRINHLAHHDALTGLPNRASFQERLELAVDDAVSEHGLAVTLLLCDLDHFKEVNDTFGHPAGDELLREAAERIRATMRKTDLLARLGGDEFAIVHITGSEPEEAHALAERIVATLNQPFEVQGNKVCIGVSIGVSSAPFDAASPVELLKQADLALYVAKRGGRDRFAAYDGGMAEQFAERRALEAELRLTIDAEGLSVHYQPQVDLESRHIIGFEALARWEHPIRGMIPPSVFIPIAEESGLIIRLGEWVLRRACRDAVSWNTEARIAVNVASQQFRHEGFVDVVRAALRESGLPPHRLELEITETAMLNDGEQMLAVLTELRRFGVRLSVDDFGTGYSALHYLQKFPFDRIKIDQSFVRELGTRDESDAIVRAVSALGVNLGVPTLAEGVETELQAKLVLGAACGEAQGYLFGHPVPASKVPEMLQSKELEAAD